MEIKELDTVKLLDGREVTVLDVLQNGAAFYVEYPAAPKPFEETDWFLVEYKDIECVI